MAQDYGLPAEYFPQQQDISRQLKLAEMLRQQSQAPLEGQMVSGHYVTPSITQYLAKALQGYNANQYEKQATKQQADMIGGYQSKVKGASSKLAEALKPKQVQTGETSTLPAFEPDQMDRFGSPLQGVQRTPIVTPQFEMRSPSIDDTFNAQIEYAQSMNNPELLNQVVGQRAQYQAQQQTLKDNQAFRAHESDLARQERAVNLQLQLQSRMDGINAQIEAAKQRGEDTRALQLQLKQMGMEFQAGQNALSRDNQAPVQIMGADGKPVYVSRNEAIGKQPYSAKQEAADAVKVQQQEQSRIASQQVLDQASELFNHVGRKSGTGVSSWMSYIPATDAKDFKANLDTFKAQTFVPMVSALKGMGALSDAEGKKLSESVGALDPSMSEEAFAKSLKTITKTLYEKAKASGLNVSLPDFAKEETKNNLNAKNPKSPQKESTPKMVDW